jgi:hypothetical protein
MQICGHDALILNFLVLRVMIRYHITISLSPLSLLITVPYKILSTPKLLLQSPPNDFQIVSELFHLSLINPP